MALFAIISLGTFSKIHAHQGALTYQCGRGNKVFIVYDGNRHDIQVIHAPSTAFRQAQGALAPTNIE